jgi:ribokinase
MVKIVVLASFNMDLVMRTARQPQPGETLQGEFAMYLGGKGFNQAVAARRLGADVSVIGHVGNDGFGRRFLEALDREGIDRRCVSVDPIAGTGVASIIVDESGENVIVQAPQANTSLTYEHILTSDDAMKFGELTVPSRLLDADIVMATLETPADVGDDLSRASVELRYDDYEHIKNRPLTMLNPAPATRIENGVGGQWSFIIANAIEAEVLTGILSTDSQSAMEAARRLAKQRFSTVVITLGAFGAVAVHEGERVDAPGFSASAIDTVGAGDAFCAAFAVATAEGADLPDAVRFANSAGALATTRQGAEPSMPRRDEVEALLAKGATR